MTTLILLPFALQSLVILFDEFYYHRRRGLPLWERLGHPLDTLSTLVCYFWVLSQPPNEINKTIFFGLAAFSCLFVTKDEFVHVKFCQAGESWLHALLFVLHPITLAVLGCIWIFHWENFYPLFSFQMISMTIFLFYQITYWGIPWKKRQL